MIKWNELNYEINTNDKLPLILERLIGTSARIEDKVKRYSLIAIIKKQNKEWSVAEHIGHLGLLERVWSLRVKEILENKEVMSNYYISDVEFEANKFNEINVADLIAGFRIKRERLCNKIATLSSEELDYISLHPRLNKKMKIVDLAYFIAEHDDYHLAKITQLLKGNL